MLQRFLLEQLLSLKTLKRQSPIIRGCYCTISFLVTAIIAMPSAQAASCKIPKSYYKNVSCTANSNYFLAVKDFGAPVALINKQGKSVADLSRYQKVDTDKISSGLFPVMRNGHVGYLNMQGREVIPVMYNAINDGQGWARPVSEGRIVVKQGNHYGVIDTSNKTVVPFSAAISEIDNYKGSLARVRKNKTISWIDKDGNAKNSASQNDNNKTDSSKNQLDSRIDNHPTANTKMPLPLANRFTTLQSRQQDGKWGFVDDDNVLMITYSFDEVRPFSEGLAGVRIDSEWGFINLGGELVIPFKFNDFDSFNGRYKEKPSFVLVEGKAWIGNLENGSKMCIDKVGAAVACD